MPRCTHLDQIDETAPAAGPGCQECLAMAECGVWVHLRRCAVCGHIGCCDDSPNRHATAHFHETGHALIQSYEPGEDWIWCFEDETAFQLAAMTPGPSHPPGWSPGPPPGASGGA